jgi:hypothetical protein
MNDLKTILGIAAVILTFIGYVPYLISLIKGKTKPHIYSWFIWTLDAFIIFFLQITHGAGSGALVTLAVGIMCLLVFTLTLRQKNKSPITKTDSIFLVIAFVALIIWLLAKQPLISAILIMLVDLFGFIPTIRKSYKNPYSENLTFYAITTFRFVLTILAIQHYSPITTLYPGVWLVCNAFFTMMLVVKRKSLK